MFTSSHLQELKRRYASMYASPVEEEIEEHCGVCGEQGIEEVEVAESFELQATMALDDVGIKSKWKKGKLYVAKRDIKKAEKALGKSFKKMKKGAEPDLYYEEVELDEGKFKKGDIVIPNMGPHKGDKHEIIHDFGDGSYNIKPLTHPRNIKYKLGATKAKENQLKLVKEEVEVDEAKSKLPPHLAKFFDKDGNLKKDAAARVAKGREKINWIDVTPKGYGPKEEVEEARSTKDELEVLKAIAAFKKKGGKIKKLKDYGLLIKILDQKNKRINLKKAIFEIARMGFNNVLLESGPILNSAFLKNNLINKIYYFQSKNIIKSNEITLMESLKKKRIESLNFKHLSSKNINGDILKIYEK